MSRALAGSKAAALASWVSASRDRVVGRRRQLAAVHALRGSNERRAWLSVSAASFSTSAAQTPSGHPSTTTSAVAAHNSGAVAQESHAPAAQSASGNRLAATAERGGGSQQSPSAVAPLSSAPAAQAPSGDPWPATSQVAAPPTPTPPMSANGGERTRVIRIPVLRTPYSTKPEFWCLSDDRMYLVMAGSLVTSEIRTYWCDGSSGAMCVRTASGSIYEFDWAPTMRKCTASQLQYERFLVRGSH